MWIVAVDSGKYQTKAIAGNNEVEAKRFSLLTKMTPTTEKQSLSPSSYVTKLNNEKFLVGSQQGFHDFETTKAKDLHRRTTYTAISQLVPNKAEIVLAIGCPLTQYTNTELRNEYMRFMLNLPEGDKTNPNKAEVEISFEVNDKKFTYTVKRLLVFPETSGFLIKYEELFERKTVAIIDIGGLNVNGAVYRRLEPNEDKFFTINKGGNVFKQQLRKELNSSFSNLNLNEDDMEDIILDGYVEINDVEDSVRKTKEIIDKHKFEFLDQIKQEMRSYSWSVNTYQFIFVGGGSILFEKEIREQPEFGKRLIISENAVWDNCEGFGMAAGLEIPVEELVLS